MSATASEQKPVNRTIQDAAYSSTVFGFVFSAAAILPGPGNDGRILGMPSVCVFYEVTGLPCPGCGLTRSFVCLEHGQIMQAFQWNLLGPPLWLEFAFLFVRGLATIIQKKPVLPFSGFFVKRMTWLTFASFILFDVIRILLLTAEHRKF